VLYVVVGAVFAGLIPYPELIQRLANEQAEPLTMALQNAAPPGVTWPATVVAFGSVIAHTAVLLVFQMGQPRIFFSIARDGLLPPVFAKVHPRFKTPHVTTILTGVVVGAFAAVMSIDEMVDLTNVGTLFAFLLVSIGIMVLRHKDPDRRRPFRVPLGPWLIPSLGVVSYVFLMYYLPPASWWRFVAWLLLGFAVYLSYGYGRSAIGRSIGRTKSSPWLKALAAGSFLVAVGLLAMPHDEKLKELLNQLGHSTRTTIALGMIGLGILLSLVAALMGMSQKERA
jgi:APA family basic amino acid/polyamine antiporter